MPKHKKSFFERLTGNISEEEDEEMEENEIKNEIKLDKNETTENQDWLEDNEEAQLTIDMYQTPTEIVVETMIAGVKPDDIDVSINKDMLTIKGKREKAREVSKENYYYKELYWGNFSRSIMLPQEVDTDNIDATVKNGVLRIRLPKIDKEKTRKIKIKSE